MPGKHGRGKRKRSQKRKYFLNTGHLAGKLVRQDTPKQTKESNVVHEPKLPLIVAGFIVATIVCFVIRNRAAAN